MNIMIEVDLLIRETGFAGQVAVIWQLLGEGKYQDVLANVRELRQSVG